METDTHWRCTNGKASFNYRMLHQVKMPREKPATLILQAWDKDILTSNDILCQWNLDLAPLLRDSVLTQGPIHLNRKFYEGTIRGRMREESLLPTFGKNMDSNDDWDESTEDDGTKFWLTTYAPGDQTMETPIKI